MRIKRNFFLMGLMLAALGAGRAWSGMDPHYHISFGYLSNIGAGEQVLVFLTGGNIAQYGQVCLFDMQGNEISCLAGPVPDQNVGDPLIFRWANASAVPMDLLVGIGFSETHVGAKAVGAVLDANHSPVMMFDQGSFFDPSGDGHAHGTFGAQAGEPQVAQFQNYPNPFKAGQGTNFVYALTDIERINHLSIRIWSASGKLVKTLSIPGLHPSGVIHWDGEDDSGSAVGTGVYVAEIFMETSDGNFSKQLRVAVLGGS